MLISIRLSPIFFSVLLLTTIVSPANAALTATTANIIEGTKPYLTYLDTDGTTVKLTSVDELLGFTMPNRDGTSGREQITTSTSTIVPPSGMSFNDVALLVAADGTSHTLSSISSVGDDDGDVTTSNLGVASGSMTATWYSKSISNANKITDAITLSQSLLMCGSPYYLVVSAISVVAKTTYGVPRINTYINSNKTYMFTSATRGVCNLQPKSMRVYSNETSSNSIFPYVDSNNPRGYNPAKWEYDSTNTTHKGFKAHSGFPTTGFNKAVFTLVMSGNQSDYTFSSTNPTIAPINSSTGVVTLNSTTKPTLPLSVTLISKTRSGVTPTGIFTYSFTITKWATVKGSESYNSVNNFTGSYLGAALCDSSFTGIGLSDHSAVSGYFFSRNELTNAPQANGSHYIYDTSGWKLVDINNTLTTIAPVTGGRFSRDVGTFMGEWGSLYSGGYSGSGFETDNYVWTGETSSSNYQFYITSYSGDVKVLNPSVKSITACR